jgi:hypothetical protein
MEVHAVPIDIGPAGNVSHSETMKQLQIKYKALKLISSDNRSLRLI